MGQMGQDMIKRIMEELGGGGTLGEITEYGIKHYPNSIRDKCQVITLLYRLRRWGDIKRGNKKNEWVLVKSTSTIIPEMKLMN
jgi:hypothetical protein